MKAISHYKVTLRLGDTLQNIFKDSSSFFVVFVVGHFKITFTTAWFAQVQQHLRIIFDKYDYFRLSRENLTTLHTRINNSLSKTSAKSPLQCDQPYRLYYNLTVYIISTKILN